MIFFYTEPQIPANCQWYWCTCNLSTDLKKLVLFYCIDLERNYNSNKKKCLTNIGLKFF